MKKTPFGREGLLEYRPRGSKVCSNCGCPRDRLIERYCKACHALYMRKWRPKYSELTPEQKLQSNCRAYANVAQRRGKLIKQPCEKCGSSSSQKHHEDYSRPLQVKWLCRPCHRALRRAREDARVKTLIESATLRNEIVQKLPPARSVYMYQERSRGSTRNKLRERLVRLAERR